jgi:hypothetical protein
MVPTLNQPVVDPTGKSNMRELFKKGRTRDFINKIAGVLGVRTSGAGYNIETTVPRKMNMGGYVYTMNDGSIVPGPNVNADIVPAVLTPGEFVVNREAAQANLPLLTAINNGYNKGGKVRFERGHVGPQIGAPKSGISNLYAGSGATSHVSQGIPIWMTSTLNQETRTGRAGLTGSQVHAEFTTALKNGRHPFEPLITAARSSGMPGEEGKILAAFDEMMNDLKGRNSKTLFVGGTANSFEKYFTRKVLPRFGRNFQNLFMSFGTAYGQRGSRDMVAQGNVSINQKTGKMSGITGRGNPLARGISSSIIGSASGGGFGAGRSRLSSSLASLALGIASRGRRRNMGGMIPGYNMGGMVPSANGQKYNMGGMVQGYNRGGMIKGLLGASAVGIGGQMLGQQVGGGLGSAITMGSYLASSMIGFGGMGGRGDQKGPGFMSRQLDRAVGPETASKLKTPIGPLNSLSTASKGLAGNLGGVAKMFGPLLKGFSTLLRLTSPLGLAITGVTAAIGFFIKAQKEKAAALETGRQAFGMDAAAAEKAGFKYTDYNAKIKEAIEDAQALKERNMMIYESMTKANVPINMTIEQYKKLKEEVKSTMGSYIDLFSQTERRDVGQVAIQLKAQFMAAGDSAEVATAKIFTMIKQSENANMAASAISSNAFQSIQNMEQASAQTVKTFEAAMKTGDAESQARALHSTFMAMDATLEETIAKQKELGASGKASADEIGLAIEQKLNSINKSFGTQANLSKDVINEIGKADPLLAEMLNDTDTLNSAWAKYRLTLSGVSLNLQSMTGDAAIAANQLNEIVKAQVQLNPAVAAANKSYKGMTDRIKELEKAQKGQSVKAQYNAKEESARLQKQIADIKKAAQDKIEGIRKATEAENTQLEIQKAQLRAQQQLIQGNMSAYAEEQMTIEQLMNEANRKDAEEAIIAKAEIDIKPLQDALDAMSKKNEDAAKKAALAGESLSGLRTKADAYNTKLTEYTTNLNNLMTKLQVEGDKFKLTKEFETTMSALKKLGSDLGIKTKPDDIINSIKNSLTGVKDVTIYTDRVRMGSMGGEGTMKSPFTLGLGGAGAGTKILPDNELSRYGKFGDFGPMGVGQRIEKLAKEKGIPSGSYFSIVDKDGKESIFRVEQDGSVTRTTNPYGKAMGGAIRKYNDGSKGGVWGAGTATSDSIPAMLSNGEYVLNAAATQKFGIPLLDQMNGSYNIPSNTRSAGANIINSPSSNNVYDINIVLNGTNVTAEDVIVQMKREMALVNAKEGISRRVGA